MNVLIASFVLVAALAAGLNALVTSRVINDYLLNAQTDRLQRDLDLTNGFYQQKLNAVTGPEPVRRAGSPDGRSLAGSFERQPQKYPDH